MVESLVNSLINSFGSLTQIPFGRELVTFIISLMPILELRGGLIAASLLDIPLIKSLIICIVGNMLPIPFILWFITPIFDWLKKTKLMSKLVHKIEGKAMSKKEQIEKFEFLGLIIFVGIPLPGTGAWTGALIASLLDINKKKALLAIFLGVLLAAFIMSIVSFGLLKSII